MSKINLVWGDSVAVRREFINTIGPSTSTVLLTQQDLYNFNYAPFVGDTTLLELTRQVIKRQTGKEYKHVALTNGASGGIVITLRAYRLKGHKCCLTSPPPYFSLYPDMIRTSGMAHYWDMPPENMIAPVNLIDNPSNPTGSVHFPLTSHLPLPIIWDAVYYSHVYGRVLLPIKHDVVVGSYSKLTGINGIRMGWIATNDDSLFEVMKPILAADYGGLSTASAMILNQILPNFDWDTFEKKAQGSLDENRYQWSRLEKYFSDQPVNSTGMFFYGPMDKAAKALFEKADILWTPGSKLGHTDEYARFNIGQSNEIIHSAVAKVLKADKIR